MIKKIICILIIFCLFGCSLCVFSINSIRNKNISDIALKSFNNHFLDNNKSSTKAYEYFKTEKSKVFINYYDGYVFGFTDDFTVNTDNFSNRVRFENTKITIDIFREVSDFEKYVNYTNRAILENAELCVTKNCTVTIDGKEVRYLSWNRPKLLRLENDKNFYVKYDIMSGNDTYTLFIKSAGKIDNPMQYLNNFELSSRQDFPIDYINSLDKKLTPAKRNWNKETNSFYSSYFSDYAGTKWGIFSPEYILGKSNLQWYEEQIDYKFPVVLHYTEIRNTYDSSVTDFLQKCYEDERYVELTLQPPLNTDSENMLFDVLNGKYDSFLEKYAQEIKKFGHPVLLRLFNEMNGDWCEYSSYQMSADTDLFISLYRYVADFFKDAENVIFVWNPNGKSFPDFNWNDAFLHYPGNDYVDILGLTAYNTGNFYEGEDWQSFEELYDDIYQRYSSLSDIPLMITEFASARCGGDKEAWARDMFDKIYKYPKIKLFVWWNSADFDANGNTARAYYINDSDEMVKIFRDNMVWY